MSTTRTSPESDADQALDERHVALALSGGGVRSSSVCTGVMCWLATCGILERVTVRGQRGVRAPALHGPRRMPPACVVHRSARRLGGLGVAVWRWTLRVLPGCSFCRVARSCTRSHLRRCVKGGASRRRFHYPRAAHRRHRLCPTQMVSVVSGGGYAGGSLVNWWAFHAGQGRAGARGAWLFKFFEHMLTTPNVLGSFNSPAAVRPGRVARVCSGARTLCTGARRCLCTLAAGVCARGCVPRARSTPRVSSRPQMPVHVVNRAFCT